MRSSPNKKENLKNASYHDVDNAFSEVWFGAGNPHGIHRATPSEVLHMIQKGWHEYSLEGFFGVLTDGPIKFVERLAKRLSEQLHHQSDRDLPRTRFPYGISTISQLQTHEAAGVLLLVLSLHCHLGWDKHQRHEKHSFVNSRHVNEKKVREYLTLFETLLCMEAWYKLKQVSKEQIDSGQAKVSICLAMDKYVVTVDRQEGKGMDLIKTHAPLHTPADIGLFGCAPNFDGGPLEETHKDTCKRPAKLTQNRPETLDQQVAKRITEKFVLDAAKHMHFGTKDVDSISIPQNNDVGGVKLTLKVSPADNGGLSYKRTYAREWNIRKDMPIPSRNFPKLAGEFLVRIVCENVETFSEQGQPLPHVEISCFTTHTRDGVLQQRGSQYSLYDKRKNSPFSIRHNANTNHKKEWPRWAEKEEAAATEWQSPAEKASRKEQTKV
jgi:hypothetical protein